MKHPGGKHDEIPIVRLDGVFNRVMVEVDLTRLAIISRVPYVDIIYAASATAMPVFNSGIPAGGNFGPHRCKLHFVWRDCSDEFAEWLKGRAAV